MKHADVVTGKMDRNFRLDRQVWQEAVKRSAQYAAALALTGKLKMLADTLHINSVFMKLAFSSQSFAFELRNVCGPSYGSEWQYLVLVSCETDPSLNVTVGGGTSEVTILEASLHEAIMYELDFQQIKPESYPPGPNLKLFLPFASPVTYYTRCIGETRN